MSAPWTGTSAPAASSQALLTITAAGGGQVVRLGSFAASIAAATSVNSTFQITDGSGGTVLLSIDLGVSASGGVDKVMSSGMLDYRASSGNALLVGFASGASGVTQKVNAGGDFVQIGVPAGARPVQS